MPELLFKDQIPLLRPWLGEEEVKAVTEIILSGWISQGPKVIEFENAVADYLGAKYAVATNSCTSALHLALNVSGVEPGDEVICPSFTCMATTNSIHHAGALPRFVEIDPQTYNIDPSATAEVITPRTRAIVVIHQIGLPADRDLFVALANKHNLVLVEDAACSFGATYKGRRLGGFGLPTCFSFHPRKMITTGEGGMIVTDDPRLAEKARVLRSTGASISDLERHKAKGLLVQQYADVGYNYRMTDIQAAIGLVQLGKIEAMLKERTAQALRYNEALAEIEEVKQPYVPNYASHAYSSYMISLGEKCLINRDELLGEMAKRGISCRVGIQPLHLEPYYQKLCGRTKLPLTEQASQKTLFLPIYPGLKEEDQKKIITTLKEIIGKKIIHGEP